MTAVDARCPQCGGALAVYFDERDTWAVCRSCRLGHWIGTGYDREAGPEAARRPPAGAIYTRAPFWREAD